MGKGTIATPLMVLQIRPMPRHLCVLSLTSRLLATGLATAALLPAVAQADATLDKIKQRGKVSIGVLVNGSAFGSIDPSNQQLVGWNPELDRKSTRLNSSH